MKESRRQHWDDFWNEKEKLSEVYSNSDRIIRNFKKITSLNGKKVLEIGAGTGRDSFPFVDAGAIVYQLDYSIPSLKLMKQFSIEENKKVEIIGGDTFNLPFADNTFDIIFHQGLLEHFRHDKATDLLKENYRVLKSGGMLCVDVPQRYHIYTLIKTFLIAINKWFAGWERSFSVPELKCEMEKLGLKTVHIYGEWMYPSLFYRTFREAIKKIGLILPLNPKVPIIYNLRKSFRDKLKDSTIAIYTSLSFGIIGKKE